MCSADRALQCGLVPPPEPASSPAGPCDAQATPTATTGLAETGLNRFEYVGPMVRYCCWVSAGRSAMWT